MSQAQKIVIPVENFILALYSDVKREDEKKFWDEVIEVIVCEPPGRQALSDWWSKHAAH